LRSTIAITATFILVSLGFEIRSRLQPPSGLRGWLGWSLAFVATIFLARNGTTLLWNMAVRLRSLRQFILGRTWIEGTWFFKTTDYKDGLPEITQVGLAQFWYELPDLVLAGRVSSVRCATGEAVQTEAISIALDDSLRYMHRFVRHVNNVQHVGAAYGTFVCDMDKAPERYEGGVIFLDAEEGHNSRQTGVKLARKEARALPKRFGSGWQQQVLHDSDWLAQFCTNYPPLKFPETSAGHAS
jgi:hypothetical protein